MKNIEEKNQDEPLAQFNARVPLKMKRAVKSAAYMAGVDLELVVQDACRLYFGLNDEMLDSRRTLVLGAFKNLTRNNKRPFEQPLIPFNDNATLTSPGASANLTPLDGVVAQLVEHHNGIVQMIFDCMPAPFSE